MSYNITGTKNLGGIIVDYLIPAPDFNSAILRFRTNDDGEFLAIALTNENPSFEGVADKLEGFSMLAHIDIPTAVYNGIIVIDDLEYKKTAFENEIVCKWTLQGYIDG